MGPAKNQTSVGDFSESAVESKQRLYDLYWRKQLSTAKIGSIAGVDSGTVLRRLEKFGIPVRGRRATEDSYVFNRRPAEWLREEYVEKYKSKAEIAEENGVCHATVKRKMDRDGIDTRPGGRYGGRNHSAWNEWASLSRSRQNYLAWSEGGGDGTKMTVHRLAAVAEYGTEAVKDRPIHHVNGLPWLNVPLFEMDIPELQQQNLRPMGLMSHAKTTSDDNYTLPDSVGLEVVKCITSGFKTVPLEE